MTLKKEPILTLFDIKHFPFSVSQLRYGLIYSVAIIHSYPYWSSFGTPETPYRSTPWYPATLPMVKPTDPAVTANPAACLIMKVPTLAGSAPHLVLPTFTSIVFLTPIIQDPLKAFNFRSISNLVFILLTITIMMNCHCYSEDLQFRPNLIFNNSC